MQFFLRNPPRPLCAWLVIAEAEQEKATGWFQHCRPTFDVLFAVLIREDMKQAAVDHAVESLRPVLQRRGVLHQEGDGQSSLGCFAFGPLDWFFEEVNAGDFVASACEEQGVIAGAAASIENRAGDLTRHVD